MLKLAIQKRDRVGKASKRRAPGSLPGVFYGRKEPSTPISLVEHDFEKIWKEAGESSVITLAGVGEDKEALIYDVDFHPVSGALRHVDFYVIEKGKTIEVSVPLLFEGTSPAVKDLGGVLIKVLHEIEIEVLPKDLPHHIVVDISSLVNFESRITVQDIVLSPGVKVRALPDDVVALVSEVEEESEETVEAPGLESIEVEKKGKEAAEGSEAETDSGSGSKEKE